MQYNPVEPARGPQGKGARCASHRTQERVAHMGSSFHAPGGARVPSGGKETMCWRNDLEVMVRS